MMKPYIVRIYAGGLSSFVAAASDEDEPLELLRTADPALARTWEKFSKARAAARDLALRFPGNAFRVDVQSEPKDH